MRNCRFCDAVIPSDDDRYDHPVCRPCAEAISDVAEVMVKDRERRGQ